MKSIMSWKTLLVCGLCAFMCPSSADAQASADGRLHLLILDAETPDTRAALDRFINVRQADVPYEESVLTDEDRATLDPEFLGAIRRDEVIERIEGQRERRYEVTLQNRRRREIVEGLRDMFVGTQSGRNLIQASAWMAESLTPYSEFIQVMDLTESDHTMDLTARTDTVQSMGGDFTHMLRMIVSDVDERTTRTQAYGTESVRVRKSLNVTISILDLNYRNIFTRSFSGETSQVQTSYGNTTGGDDYAVMLRAALSQAGEAIADHFTASLTVTLRPPRGEEAQFDPGMVSIYVNDEFVQEDMAIRLTKGTHTLRVESEDYAEVTREINLQRDTTLPIALQSAFGYLTVSVPPNAGVEAYDLVIELEGEDGSVETLYGEGPHRVQKGQYTVRCQISGFQPHEQPYRLTGGTEDRPTRLTIPLRPQPAPAQAPTAATQPVVPPVEQPTATPPARPPVVPEMDLDSPASLASKADGKK
jgi:hypothetical protein